MTDPTTITFNASFPPLQSAITIDGLGEGARIKLDIPACDVEAVILLQAFCMGKPLIVTVEVAIVGDEKKPRYERKRDKTGQNGT